jgi:hypothetical protein
MFEEDTSDYVSKSRVLTYSGGFGCPLQYKKVYIDKEPQSGYALSVGSRVHHWLDIFFDYAEETDNWESFVTDDYSEYEKVMLYNFINYERERLKRFNYNYGEWKPKARELKVVNHEHKMRGVLDRVVDDWTVIEDYKNYLIDEYLRKGSDIGTKNIKMLNKLLNGDIKELVCIEEYKSSKKVGDDLPFEFGFYKILLETLDEYKGKEFVARLINPRINVYEFIPILGKTYVLKRIDKLREAIANNDFKPKCNPVKFGVCRRCSLDECGLYGVGSEWKK